MLHNIKAKGQLREFLNSTDLEEGDYMQTVTQFLYRFIKDRSYSFSGWNCGFKVGMNDIGEKQK